jgi:glucokinase
MEKKVAIGIDLGGTNIRIGLVTQDGALVAATRMPTQAAEGYAQVKERTIGAVKELLLRTAVGTEVVGGGIGCPGIVDTHHGILTYSANLGWRDTKIGQELREVLGIPIFVDQDAIAAGLGEHWLGAGQGSCHQIYLAVGTGIGAGIIIAGKPYLGAHGVAGNIGHVMLQEDGPLCSCGRRGCLEALASGPAVARRARQALQEGDDAGPLALLHKAGIEITSKEVADAAKEGDPLARQIMEASGRYLGQGLALLANVIDPQVIIIGGGLSQAGDCLLGSARAEFRHRILDPAKTTAIVTAQLGDNAGMIGAAWLVWKNV